MNDADDPLADDTPAATPQPVGPCQRCGDDGWVSVTDRYVEHHAPGDLAALEAALDALRYADADEETGDPGRPDRTGTEEYAALWDTYTDLRSRRGAFANSVFPCPECRQSLFLRWAAGCLRPEHRATACERCIAVLGKKRAAQHDRSAFPGVPVT